MKTILLTGQQSLVDTPCLSLLFQNMLALVLTLYRTLILLISSFHFRQSIIVLKLIQKKARIQAKRRYSLPSHRHQMKRNSGDILSQLGTIRERTGLYPAEFEDLFLQVAEQLVQPRWGSKRQRIIKTSLNARMRLMLALESLRGS